MVMIKGTYEILKKKALPSTPFHLQFRVANTPSKGKCQLFPFFEFRMSFLIIDGWNQYDDQDENEDNADVDDVYQDEEDDDEVDDDEATSKKVGQNVAGTKCLLTG